MATFVKPNQAAIRLGVPAKWLRDEAKAGRVPHIVAGRRILLDPSAVELALSQRAADAGKGGKRDTAATITPELLTTAQAATLCGVSLRHFQRMDASGRIGPRARRLLSAVRWNRAELLQWIQGGCVSRVEWERSR